MSFKAYSIALAITLASCAPASSQPSLVTRDVATGLDTPWEILWGPDNWIWMTERGGRISRVDPAGGDVVPLLTIPDVFEQSESGLLGMALHPDFAEEPWVYLVYNYRIGNAIAERLVRYRYNGQTLVDPDTLLTDVPGYPTHDGSRLLVLDDGTLLMTTGDAQDQPAAQSHTSLNGKVLRMNLDGSPAGDNPFASAPFPANYIWTTGHRNSQGLVRGANGIVYESEHGPNNDDEVNIIERGRNYGWPTVHGMCDLITEEQFCSDSNVVEPIAAYTPTLAVAGLDYYSHDAIPEWSGSLLMVSLKESELRQLKLDAAGRQVVSQTVYFDEQFGRLRDLCIAPDGRVFIATSNHDGRARGQFPLAGDDRIIEIRGATGSMREVDPSRGELRVTPSTPRGTLEIYARLERAGSSTISLHDANGGLRWQETSELPAQEVRRSIDVSSLPRGAYFVRLLHEGLRLVEPVIVD